MFTYFVIKNKIYMDINAFLLINFIGCFVLSITAYSIYTGFGSVSKNLRDPFDEHED